MAAPFFCFLSEGTRFESGLTASESAVLLLDDPHKDISEIIHKRKKKDKLPVPYCILPDWIFLLTRNANWVDRPDNLF